MEKEKNQTTEKSEEKTEQRNDWLYNLYAVSPKVKEKLLFHFRNMSDLPALIGFVGKAPVINEDLSLRFGRSEIHEGDFVERSQYGTVVNIYSSEEVEKLFKILASKEYTDEYKNLVIPKEVKEKKK